MALPRHEEEAFQALVRDLRPRRRGRPAPPTWARLLITVACVAGIVLAGVAEAPWMAIVSWIGLIWICLANVTGDDAG